MSIPVIRATTCPSAEELARDFVIVVTAFNPGVPGSVGQINVPALRGEAGYIGRLPLADELSEDAAWPIVISDVFDYHCELHVDPERKMVGPKHAIIAAHGGGITRMKIFKAIAMYRLDALADNAVRTIREAMIPAWDGRAMIRERAAGLARP